MTTSDELLRLCEEIQENLEWIASEDNPAIGGTEDGAHKARQYLLDKAEPALPLLVAAARELVKLRKALREAELFAAGSMSPDKYDRFLAAIKLAMEEKT